MNARTNLVIRLWAGLDLMLTGLLVLPPIAVKFLDLLLSVNAVFGGQAELEDVSGFGLLFLCLAGALGVAWAVARLLRPSWWLGAIDAAARLWVGGLIVYFVFAYSVPGILLLFVVTEWIGGGHQAWHLFNAGVQRPEFNAAPAVGIGATAPASQK